VNLQDSYIFLPKVNSTNNRSNQLSLLTLAPSSWTHEQISAYFGVSKYQAAQANDLKIQSGILAHPPKKKNGHCLSDGKNFSNSQVAHILKLIFKIIQCRGKIANNRFLYFR
jgi:hypothetical protein